MSIFGSGGTPPASEPESGAGAAPVETPEPASAPEPVTPPSADGGRATVVVANLEPDVCEVLARVVEAAGHKALRVTERGDVVATVLDRQAGALVLDAGSGNLDVLRELRGEGFGPGAGVRVVVIGTGPASARLAWQQGADAVLHRPFPATELGRELASVLGRDEGARDAERRSQIAALGG